MDQLFKTPLVLVIPALLFLPLLGWLLTRVWIERTRTQRLRALLFSCWKNYLEALSDSLPKLRAFRAFLAKTRPASEDAELARICASLYEVVRREIGEIERQLEQMTNLPDSQWHDMPLHWRAAMDTGHQISALIREALNRFSKEQMDGFRAEWADELKREHEQVAESLQREIMTLRVRIEELERTLEETARAAREKPSEVVEVEKVVEVAAEQDEDAIAARYVERLEDNLPADKIETELTKLNGELFFLRNQQQDESLPEEERRKLGGKIAWLEQATRWWKIQQRLRRNALLLDELTGRELDEANAGQDDMETIAEFQRMESENAEMRNRMKQLQAVNRNLTRTLEGMDSEKADLEQTRATLRQVDKSRRDAERELVNMESMMDQMQAEITRLRSHADHVEILRSRIVQLEKKAAENEKAAETMRQEMLEVAAEADRESASRQARVAQLEEELAEARELAAKASAAGTKAREIAAEEQALESEMMELQKAYDDQHNQMLQHKTARAQAEKSETKTREELEKLKRTYQELLLKHRALRDEYTALKMENNISTDHPQP